jgi:hypothetical protein
MGKMFPKQAVNEYVSAAKEGRLRRPSDSLSNEDSGVDARTSEWLFFFPYNDFSI